MIKNITKTKILKNIKEIKNNKRIEQNHEDGTSEFVTLDGSFKKHGVVIGLHLVYLCWLDNKVKSDQSIDSHDNILHKYKSLKDWFLGERIYDILVTGFFRVLKTFKKMFIYISYMKSRVQTI